MKNYFTPIDAITTKLASETEFNMKGFMKIIALIMPGAFKKQSQKFLNDFKTLPKIINNNLMDEVDYQLLGSVNFNWSVICYIPHEKAHLIFYWPFPGTLAYSEIVLMYRLLYTW